MDKKSARDLPHVFVPVGIGDLCKCWRVKSDPIHVGGQFTNSEEPKPETPKGNELVFAK